MDLLIVGWIGLALLTCDDRFRDRLDDLLDDRFDGHSNDRFR